MATHERRAAPRPALGALGGLATFPLAVSALNLVQRDDYDALTQPMSQLALGTAGWALTLAFCATGVGLLLLALALRRAVPGARVAPVLLGLAGVLHLVDAAFPTDARAAAPTAHGLIQDLAGLATFVLLPLALFAAGRSFRAQPSWHAFGRATVVWGGLALVGLLVLLLSGGLGRFGAGQRLGVATWFSWLLVLAWRLHTDGGRATGLASPAPARITTP